MAVQNAVAPTVPITVPTVSETVVVTTLLAGSTGANTPNPAFAAPIEPALFKGIVVLALGTGTTSVTVRLRLGTGLTGAIVASFVLSAVVAADDGTLAIPIWFYLPLAQPASTYTLSVQQASASGAGSVVYAGIETEG
jgi:hypothetical protein